ncbi:MAG: DNA methylase [Eubacteriaceae bacterium]|nr:DNA methylase [Eubacteriaceae bacterium]
MDRIYLCIDLKSFYASVECVERGLDPLTTNLVVADESRTEKTICLAVSPSLKSYGISSRARLFEVNQRVNDINAQRKAKAPGRAFSGSSYDDNELKACDSLKLDFIKATPRMAFYLDYSAKIHDIYLEYIAAEDIHVYSIDEVFMDITDYLCAHDITAEELAMRIILDVVYTSGITATAGIGTNMYLSKIAMDIHAKKIPPDKNGVRIARLDEMSYREHLWAHRPLTDFWRVGRGYAKKLEALGLYTMGDIARFSLENEERLYKLFGINAELLIDHAWGWEPCKMSDVKNYKPSSSGLASGQVLQYPYTFEKAKLIVWEMADRMALDLMEKGLVTDQVTLTVGYDAQNLTDPNRAQNYKGEIKEDFYGRKIPKHSHSTINLSEYTSSSKKLVEAVVKLYEKIANRDLLIRKITVGANRLLPEGEASKKPEQLSLLTDCGQLGEKQEKKESEKERRTQKALLEIQRKYGKNAAIKAVNLREEATAIQRNKQIGGHKA